jgi:hypothetical protein
MAGHALADPQIEHAGGVMRVLDDREAARLGDRDRAPVDQQLA